MAGRQELREEPCVSALGQPILAGLWTRGSCFDELPVRPREGVQAVRACVSCVSWGSRGGLGGGPW